MSPAPAGADTTTGTVTEYVMPAPMIDSNCVSQFQDVGCGFPQQQVAGILVPPAVEEIVEIVPIIQKRFQQSIEEQIVRRPHLLEKVGGKVTLQNKSQ